MTIRNELERLDHRIRQLKIDSERFFNGALPMPPEELRLGVFAQLRRLRDRRIPSYADRYLLNALEARLNSLNELYHRRLRESETGGQGRPQTAAAAASGDSRGVLFEEGHAALESAQVLYDELYGRGGREHKTDFASFFDFLRAKAAKIRRVTGHRQVQFRVDHANGEPTLRAKAVRGKNTRGQDS